MSERKNIDRADEMGRQLGEIQKQVLPPPALERAVIEDIPYGQRVRTATHIKRFAKAVAAYVVGVALFLGVVMLLPGLWEEKTPVGSDSVGSDPVGSDPVGSDPVDGTTTKDEWKDCLLPEVAILNITPYDYESVGSPDPGTMSAEVEAEIKQAFAALHDRITAEDVTVNFIANINGKYAVQLDGKGMMHLGVYMVESVCGLTFVGGSPHAIKIYANGQLYSLSNAYEKGILSSREVQELYVISHYTTVSAEIREKCALRYGGKSDDYFVRIMQSRSRDGGKTVWYIVDLYGSSIPVTNKPTSEAMNEYLLNYANSRKLEVYYEGRFYTLTQALESGILEDSDIRALYEACEEMG